MPCRAALMPLAKQPWGGEVGWLTDQFGINWTVNIANAWGGLVERSALRAAPDRIAPSADSRHSGHENARRRLGGARPDADRRREAGARPPRRALKPISSDGKKTVIARLPEILGA